MTSNKKKHNDKNILTFQHWQFFFYISKYILLVVVAYGPLGSHKAPHCFCFLICHRALIFSPWILFRSSVHLIPVLFLISLSGRTSYLFILLLQRFLSDISEEKIPALSRSIFTSYIPWMFFNVFIQVRTLWINLFAGSLLICP